MVPYTMDAVQALRHAAETNVPAVVMLSELGWDRDMLARVCKRHGIALPGLSGDGPAIAPSVDSPDAAPTAPLYLLRSFAGRLSGDAGKMLTALARHNPGTIIKSAQMGVKSGNATRAMHRANKLLRESNLSWAIISVQRNPDNSGYRLMRMEDKIGEGVRR